MQADDLSLGDPFPGGDGNFKRDGGAPQKIEDVALLIFG